MKKATAVVVMVLSGLLSPNAPASAQDAAGCQDHPLIPRMTGYTIRGCSNDDSSADVEIMTGGTTETIPMAGRSTALMYAPGPDLEATPSVAQVREHFENAIKEHGGTQLGVTVGQEWPVYTMVKDNQEFWVVLLIHPPEYFTGSFSYRIIEKSVTLPD